MLQKHLVFSGIVVSVFDVIIPSHAHKICLSSFLHFIPSLMGTRFSRPFNFPVQALVAVPLNSPSGMVSQATTLSPSLALLASPLNQVKIDFSHSQFSSLFSARYCLGRLFVEQSIESGVFEDNFASLLGFVAVSIIFGESQLFPLLALRAQFFLCLVLSSFLHFPFLLLFPVGQFCHFCLGHFSIGQSIEGGFLSDDFASLLSFIGVSFSSS